MLRSAMDLVVRRQPVAVLAVVLLAGMAVPIDTPSAVLALVPVYGIAVYRSWRAAAVAVTAVAAAVLAHALLYDTSAQAGSVFAQTASSTAIAAAVAAIGAAVAERRRARERESALLAERAAAEERLRIARELHDAVGHDVSLMIVQAQALGATAGNEAVLEATDAIAALGRRTMREMHRTVRLLRDEGATHHPSPGLLRSTRCSTARSAPACRPR